MHPHFLFNALSGIAELTVADPPRAERAILGLAGLYRTILATSRQRAVSLEQELALVKSYLTLEKVRFGDRLTFRLDVDGDPTAPLIPPPWSCSRWWRTASTTASPSSPKAAPSSSPPR
jgi:LytS/YehU family sensor histidine kinase